MAGPDTADPLPGQLDLLYDHYKETFALIRAREQQRDRLFLWLLGLYFALIVEIKYPSNLHGALGPVAIAGNSINVKALPLGLVLSASWVFIAAVALKYYQLVKTIDRQYPYLHRLEDHISVVIGDDEVFRREGREYLQRYPRLLDWAWIAYTCAFPIALIFATAYLYAVEVTSLDYHWTLTVFDLVFALGIVVTIVLYRFFPTANRRTAASYLDVAGSEIKNYLPGKHKRGTPADLLRLYAVILLAKGDQVTLADVHNAWSVWAQDQQPNDNSIKPFRDLSPEVQQLDAPFVEAIRQVARDRKEKV